LDDDSFQDLLVQMREQGSDTNRMGMKRYGINVDNAWGISIPWLRSKAKEMRNDHRTALRLWGTNIHEARILASIIDDPAAVDREQMDDWVSGFNSWDLCDQCCGNLFVHTDNAREVIPDWCGRPEEFVRRAGFVMIAALAVKDKKSPTSSFEQYLPLLEKFSTDGRNNVKKGVNWAIRQVGKRDLEGRELVLPLARRLSSGKDRVGRWIGKDAVRELGSEKVSKRLDRKSDHVSR
jgi:3-methyladenine DNA glycosylase AlkD